jgi:hypothetical protein
MLSWSLTRECAEVCNLHCGIYSIENKNGNTEFIYCGKYITETK